MKERLERGKAVTRQIREDLRRRVEEALRCAAAAGDLKLPLFPTVTIEVPREKDHGDYATAVALGMARTEKRAPREIAEKIVRHLPKDGVGISRIEIAGPGFINFFLAHDWLHDVLRLVQAMGSAYGQTEHGAGKKVQVEFVSANPTGPLNVVNARAAAVGDTLVRILAASGYDAHREFYINDAGNQVARFGLSVEARLRELVGQKVQFPADGYPGEYVRDLARKVLERDGEVLLGLNQEERVRRLAEFGVREMVKDQKALLARYGVEYEVWFSEKSLRDEGAAEKVVEVLQGRGYTYEKDGAVWFKSTIFGDDKDRVLVKSNGEFTYLVPDIAYHWNKYDRGFETVIDLLGPDHHGYIDRLRAAVEAGGYDPRSLEVIIVQMVRLIRGGRPVRISKRAGEFVTMEELLDEVGKDAARFFFLMRSADSHLDFDLDLARVQGNENPVYYVQYAHARICSILQEAEKRGVAFPDPAEVDLTPLATPEEVELMKKIAALPEEIIEAAEAREPHRLTVYARDLATLFHSFYTECRVLGAEPGLTAARLVLVDCTRIVLRNVLELLGISAPERM